MLSVREELADRALELGFDAVGWASASVLTRDLKAFDAWCARGMHAGMEYLPLSSTRRAGLQQHLPQAKSALVLAVSHAHADPGVPVGGTRVGRVARFAWSCDYHSVLEPFLEELVRLAERFGVWARGYVDHGPIFERSLAERAGIGWRGRSSQLISTELGALSSLAVLLVDLEPIDLEPTALEPGGRQGIDLVAQTHPDRCGRCTRCVTVCPTDAINDEREVDARRCLAYFTVEHRGAIPLEFRVPMSDHLFGCDDCLDICPWTVRAGPLARLLEPVPEFAHPDLELFFGSNRAFERIFAGSAILRARRAGLARNAAIVLGNTGDEAHIPLLERALEDKRADVRETAAWGLGRIGSVRTFPSLERAMRDPDKLVCRTAREAIRGTFAVEHLSGTRPG